MHSEFDDVCPEEALGPVTKLIECMPFPPLPSALTQ